MAAKPILGQTAEIPGPKKAFIAPGPEVVASMMKKAKRALLAVGSEATDVKTKDGDLVDYAIRLSRLRNTTVVATGHLVKEFRKRGAEDVHSMPFTNLGDRLRDRDWKGLDGEGPYDLVLFVGFPYYIEWLLLSGLKSFAADLKTISLDNVYQPHANWSMGSMAEAAWREALDKVASILEGGG